MWSRQFNLKTVGIWKHIWNFTYKELKENKFKQFKFRLIYCILSCGELLYKWKMKENPLYIFCDRLDNYIHVFCNCPRTIQFWAKVKNAFLNMGISNLEFSLKTLIIGYKLCDKDYNWVNQILTICYFIFQFCLTSSSPHRQAKVMIQNKFTNFLNFK